MGVFFFQAEDGIRDLVRSRGLGDVYKRQLLNKKVYYNQILSETILLFIDAASKKTGAGFLYLSLIHI